MIVIASYTIEKDLKEEIDKLAKEYDRSASWVARKAFRLLIEVEKSKNEKIIHKKEQ